MAWVNVFTLPGVAAGFSGFQYGYTTPIVDPEIEQELGSYCGIPTAWYKPGATFTEPFSGGGFIEYNSWNTTNLAYSFVRGPFVVPGTLFRSRIYIDNTTEIGTVPVTVGYAIRDTLSSDEITFDLTFPEVYTYDTDASLSEWHEHGGIGTATEGGIYGLAVYVGAEGQYSYKVEWQIWVEDPPPIDPFPSRTSPGFAYEIDKGWSFDGNYIPHFAELNWYFGDNPVDFTGIQKIRIHGLTKGRTFLQVSTNGMEPESLDYLPDYSEPQYCDLPKSPYFVSSDYVATTNYTDTANRGLSIQMKFEGRNEDIDLPEPSHVLQVLVLQSSPQGTGARGN